MSEPGGTLYAIGAEGTSLVKIGYTTGSVTRRMQRLQTGQPFRLRVIATLPVEQDAKQKEAVLHAFLAEERRQGEWFAIEFAPEDFAGLLERAIAWKTPPAPTSRERCDACAGQPWWKMLPLCAACESEAEDIPMPEAFLRFCTEVLGPAERAAEARAAEAERMGQLQRWLDQARQAGVL